MKEKNLNKFKEIYKNNLLTLINLFCIFLAIFSLLLFLYIFFPSYFSLNFPVTKYTLCLFITFKKNLIVVLVIYYVIKNNFLKKKNTNKVIVQKLLQLILNIFKKVFFKKKNAKTLIFSSKHFQALAILLKCNEQISVFEVL